MVVWTIWKCLMKSMPAQFEIEVDVNGVKEPWLLMFKNETQ